MSFLDLICESASLEPIERRRLFVAAKMAGVDNAVIDRMSSQPYSGEDFVWTCRVGDHGFSGDLDYCLDFLSFLDDVAGLAVMLRCLVYGKASPKDFSKDEDRFSDDWNIWSDRLPF